MPNRLQGALALAMGIASAAAFAANTTFVPDVVFKGSSLQGWTKLGAADWRAEDGEIVALPAAPGGGWLLADKGYQDVAFYSSFRCADAGCKPGVVLRTAKTEGGFKGVLLSLAEGDAGLYEIQLDANGAELKRDKLGAGPAPLVRMSVVRPTSEEPVPGFSKAAPTREEVDLAAQTPRSPSAASGRGGGGGRPINLPAGQWHTVTVILDTDAISAAIDGRRGISGSTRDRMMGFGPIGLYAGGVGEVRFKEIAYKDLNPKIEPKELVSPNFRMQRLNDFYYGWCAAAADINRDGVKDVIAGPFYYLGPEYTERREFTTSRTYNPSNQFAQAMINFAHDFTGDGWPDILVVDQRPIYLYVNPQGESRRWDRFLVVPNNSMEINLLKDIDGDGKPEIIFASGGVLSIARPDPANPTGTWLVEAISEKTNIGAHGLGAGDINGDGRVDIVGPSGWWEQPVKGSAAGAWTFHAASFGSGGAEMGVYDVNGDGHNDVVTSLSAHGWGLAWFEQKRDAAGVITFAQHNIMRDFTTTNAGGVTFSEPHAATFADIDGDGLLDIIVGKRHFSHLETYLDPDPYGAAVLYWYRTVRNPKAEGGAEFVPELIHNRSGVGSHLAVEDLNNDGSLDILTSTNRGTFVFFGRLKAKR